MRKLFVPLLAMGMVVFADFSYAAFGGSRSSGVSRSYSRPATPSYSKPATTYKTPTYTNSRPSSSSSSYKSNYSTSSNYSNSNYRNDSYQPRQSSTMRDIGVTAAGVGGGILAASAITALISSPGHAGMYTHPQYPGQYFNQQGQPIAAPQPRAVQQEQYLPEQSYTQPVYQQPQQVVVVQRQQDTGVSFFGALWGALWFLIKLAFFLSVVGAIGYGAYKLVQSVRNKTIRDQVQKARGLVEETLKKTASEIDDLDAKAMDIFYDFQKNSNDESWLNANTKYMPIDEDSMAPPSKVLAYQQRTIDCGMEQGKLRGTVQYTATLNDGSGALDINQYWNFEKDNGVWKLIGIEQID